MPFWKAQRNTSQPEAEWEGRVRLGAHLPFTGCFVPLAPLPLASS